MSERISPVEPIIPSPELSNRKPKTPPIPGETDEPEVQPKKMQPRQKEVHDGAVDIEA